MDNNLRKYLEERLLKIINGMLDSNEFELIFSAICNELEKFPTKNALNNFFRVLNSLYDKFNFFKNSIKYDYYIKALFSLTANSNYLTDILIRNPEFLYLILDNNNINLTIKKRNLKKELYQNANRYKSFEAKVNYVKLFKRKYTLIIAYNDTNKIYSLQKTTLYLSILAIVISDYVLSLIINTTANKFSINKISRKYSLISLGKLGGNELNYSSDIDLMFIYDKNTYINKHSSITSDIFFNTAISSFINVMSEITDKGYIYRVDFRLRPDGKNSSLTNSITAYINYYELRGEEWERQMLLKMGFVSGSKSLYKKFYNFVLPYVFSKTFISSPLERIKKMKYKIEYQNELNIKLCKGGIRDIEFSVQALQLIHGSKYKKLFTGNSIYALKLLYKYNIISINEYKTLLKSYIFYRKMEHYLQLMNDRQTHTIPIENDLFNLMLLYFEFNSADMFFDLLNKHKTSVRTFFNSVFNTDSSESETTIEKFNIEQIRFNDLNRAKKNYNYLKTGADIVNNKGFDNKTIELFSHFEIKLLEILNNSDFPDIILDNFTRGIKSVYFPSIWYNIFKDENYLNMFTKLCLFSDRAFNIWALDKKVSDLLLTGRVFYKDFIYNNTHRPVNQLLFIISVQYALKIIDENDIGIFLSHIISNKIQNCYKRLNINYLTVMGFGSFGTNSMNFASDIDLMFITDNKTDYEKSFKEATALINLLKTELFPFKFDFRLRPEGGSSQIVWELDSFKNYLKTRARIWEFQAFQKVRFIIGDFNVFQNLLDFYFIQIKSVEPKNVVNSIIEMRKNIIKKNLSIASNIKYSEGALQDIDFLIQYAFFLYPNKSSELLNLNFMQRFTFLTELMNDFEISELLLNYNFLKKIELSNQNIFGVNNSNITNDNMKLKRLILFLNKEEIDNFKKEISSVLNMNNELFNKYLGSY
jgi:glutamate-ammonia-ligase adenylyltransferase